MIVLRSATTPPLETLCESSSPLRIPSNSPSATSEYTDFQITDQQKCALIGQGYDCTCRYLNAWLPPGQTPISHLALGRATRIETTGMCGAAWSTPTPKP